MQKVAKMVPPAIRRIACALVVAALTLSLPTASARSPDCQTAAGVFTVRANDTIPPGCITDLRIGETADGSGSALILYWTAPGDDDMVGTATLYEIRYARAPILTEADWEAAIPLPGVPAPGPAGSAESCVVVGLEDDGAPYYFCVRAADEVFNWSCLSNSPGTRQRVPGFWPFRVFLPVAARGNDAPWPGGADQPVRRALLLAR